MRRTVDVGLSVRLTVRSLSPSRSDMTSWQTLDGRELEIGAPEPTAVVPCVRRRRVLEAQTIPATGAAIGPGWDQVEQNVRVGTSERARPVARPSTHLGWRGSWAQPAMATPRACTSVVSHRLPSVPLTSPISPAMIPPHYATAATTSVSAAWYHPRNRGIAGANAS
jgi:hypothetical protein